MGSFPYRVPARADDLFLQEERDHQLGRVFGAEAVIKAGVPFGSGLNTHAWEEILDLIFELARNKAWIREQCGWILYNAIQCLNEQSNGTIYAEVLTQRLVAVDLARSLEGIAIWLGVQLTFPGANLPPQVWRQENPLHRKEISTLARILKESSGAQPLQAEPNNKVAPNTAWSPNLHFAWDVIMASIFKRKDLDHGKFSHSIRFEDFWGQAVNGAWLSIFPLPVLIWHRRSLCSLCL